MGREGGERGRGGRGREDSSRDRRKRAEAALRSQPSCPSRPRMSTRGSSARRPPISDSINSPTSPFVHPLLRPLPLLPPSQLRLPGSACPLSSPRPPAATPPHCPPASRPRPPSIRPQAAAAREEHVRALLPPRRCAPRARGAANQRDIFPRRLDPPAGDLWPADPGRQPCASRSCAPRPRAPAIPFFLFSSPGHPHPVARRSRRRTRRRVRPHKAPYASARTLNL